MYHPEPTPKSYELNILSLFLFSKKVITERDVGDGT
jgi:hypothetical protein